MKLVKLLLTGLFLSSSYLCFAQLRVSQLRTNGLNEPIGTPSDKSHTFSWVLESDKQNTYQTAYRIKVNSGNRTIWDSGKVMSDNSTSVEYKGELSPDTEYQWSLRVWDNHGNTSENKASRWHTGIRIEDWKAEWISTSETDPSYFRTFKTLTRKIRKATAYVTSHGIYEAFINGYRIGDAYLTPGWTSYEKRLQYQAYDVTSLLQKGKNAISAVVTPGWYSGGMGVGDAKNRFIYGNDVSLLMQINIEYNDGSSDIIVTDGSWECCVPAKDKSVKAGGITFANIYDGQTTDARLIDRLWTTVSPQSAWKRKVVVKNFTKDNLIATINEPVKVYEKIPAKKLIITPKGEKVIDFGQNVVGWEKVKISGESGDSIRITHAEILDKDGNFYTENMRSAKTTSLFIANGDRNETFEPVHTFYGFRYIKVEGLKNDLKLEDFEAIAISSGFEKTGSFNSSNSEINQLQHNIEWGFRDNFVDVPTDCPQRDERLGWTGDAQVFYRTATFIGKVDAFFRKWLADLKADQKEDGRVPRIIPNIYSGDYRTAATGWADACCIIPWNQYMAYGDVHILKEQFESMKLWVDYMVSQSKHNGWLWNTGSHYGDWLFYSLTNDLGGDSAVTSRHLIAQCFFANSADIVSKAASVLGYEADAKYYASVATDVRKAYMNEYVTPNGLISSDTQTAYILALQFEMLPENLRKQATDRLVANIERYNNHITTGFLGTSYICNVLTDNGRSDVAYKLLLQETCPSWIYSVKKGATTIWERWNSIMEDGSIINGMNSFNHYSYGAIGDWLYRSAVGIRESSPGYKRIIIKPHTGGDFKKMQAHTMTPYGKVAVEWSADDNSLTMMRTEIPVNTTAEIYVPALSIEEVVSHENLRPEGYSNGYVKFVTGSGHYRFSILGKK